MASGAPTGMQSAALTIGERGPVLFQDINLIDELSHFTHERIPERNLNIIYHAKFQRDFKTFLIPKKGLFMQRALEHSDTLK